MRKNWLVISFLVAPLLFYLLVQSLMSGRQTATPLHAANGAGESHMPIVLVPEATATPTATETPTATATATPTETPTATPTPEASLDNGSFEEHWVDINDRVQQPNYWDLYRIPKGESLFDAPDDIASGTCECKHLLNRQLPGDQQIGGPDALILDGLTVYKLFGVYESWGSELSQTVEGLQPGSNWRLTVPIRVHLHGDTFDWSAESSVWVNDAGYWANGIQMGDENWCKLEQVFEVPQDGKAEIAIRVKSKYPLPKDFFIDDIQLHPESDPAPYQDMDPCLEKPTLISYKPAKSR